MGRDRMEVVMLGTAASVPLSIRLHTARTSTALHAVINTASTANNNKNTISIRNDASRHAVSPWGGRAGARQVPQRERNLRRSFRQRRDHSRLRRGVCGNRSNCPRACAHGTHTSTWRCVSSWPYIFALCGDRVARVCAREDEEMECCAMQGSFGQLLRKYGRAGGFAKLEVCKQALACV